MQFTSEQKLAAKALLDAFNGNVDASQKALALLHKSHPLTVKKLARTSSESIISTANLSKSYKVGRTKVQALNDVSVTINRGEFVAITGTSGSGKSTLLHLLGGLDKPGSGQIEIAGHLLAKMNDKQLAQFRNKTTGFVFQFFYLQPFLSLKNNIEVPAMFARQKRSVRAARSTMLADTVGLADRLSHLPRELSGGQMQRAAIARALQNNPQILFADEPTGNLDRANALAIFELFEKIRDEQGTTIVVVTHDRELAAMADRVIAMQDGAVT
jgi:ABC-type lipoprotein export system ATPase subunit